VGTRQLGFQDAAHFFLKTAAASLDRRFGVE
jgi:hypothetical protein